MPDGSHHGQWALAFSSHSPEGISVVDDCMESPYGVTQMFIAADGDATVPVSAGGSGGSGSSSGGGAAAVGSRMQCGFTRRHEKNWIGFQHAGQLHFVYSIYPHSVVLVRAADGSCVQRWSTSSYAPLSALAATGEVFLHGSASAIPYGDDTYLALFHSREAGSSGAYTTFAYTFASSPPFAVTAVSRPLPLLGGGKAFASGLALLPNVDKLLITYGYADMESRALVMSHSGFNATMWDWCAYTWARDLRARR